MGKLLRQNFHSGTVHIGLFPAVLFGTFSMGFPVTAAVLHRECGGSQVQWWHPHGIPSALGLCSCCSCPPAGKCACLSSHLLDFAITFCFWHHPQWFFLWKNELLLYREMDLTVWKKQVTSHHYLCQNIYEAYVYLCKFYKL